MNKYLKIILIIVSIFIMYFMLDFIYIYTINKPVISIKNSSNMYEGIFYNVYYCNEDSPTIKLKNNKFSCETQVIEDYIYVENINENKITKTTIVNDETKGSYTIYYYGIKSAFIKIDNKTYDFATILASNKITFDEIIEYLKEVGTLNDKDIIIYRDGGTKKYLLENYTIIKCNTLDNNKDIYIGNKSMDYIVEFCK